MAIILSLPQCVNSLLRLTTKKHQRSVLLSLCERNQPVDSPHKGTVAENGSIWWRQNVWSDQATGFAILRRLFLIIILDVYGTETLI